MSKVIYEDETAVLEENESVLKEMVIKFEDGKELKPEKAMMIFLDGTDIKIKFTNMNQDELDLMFYACKELTKSR